ncbi:hypothetical protein ES708_25126 [subsurface metagenome]
MLSPHGKKSAEGEVPIRFHQVVLQGKEIEVIIRIELCNPVALFYINSSVGIQGVEEPELQRHTDHGQPFLIAVQPEPRAGIAVQVALKVDG